MQLVGFELAPALFDQLQETGLLKELATRTRRDAGGRMSVMQVGKVSAFLARPKTAEAAGAQLSAGQDRECSTCKKREAKPASREIRKVNG